MTDPEAVELLLDAVSTASISGREAELVALMAGAMGRSADEAFVDAAGNAVGRWGDGPMNLTFLAHLDTVRGRIEPRLADGWLHGRGAVDAKGPLCAAVAAASRLGAEAREALCVRVVAAVEEEASSSRGARYAAKTYPRPDALVVCEPSGWQRYTLGYKGNLSVRLRCEAAEGHGAAQAAGPTELVVEAWRVVQAWALQVNELGGRQFDTVQVRLASINSGSDGLRARCAARIALRLPPGLPWRDAAAALRRLRLPEPVTIEVGRGLDACIAPRDSRLAACFRSAIRSLGGVPVATLKTGTSDWNVVAERWERSAPSLALASGRTAGPSEGGLREDPSRAHAWQVVAYGPGDSSLDHSPEERLEVAEYLRSIEVLEGVVRGLWQPSGGQAVRSG